MGGPCIALAWALGMGVPAMALGVPCVAAAWALGVGTVEVSGGLATALEGVYEQAGSRREGRRGLPVDHGDGVGRRGCGRTGDRPCALPVRWRGNGRARNPAEGCLKVGEGR